MSQAIFAANAVDCHFGVRCNALGAKRATATLAFSNGVFPAMFSNPEADICALGSSMSILPSTTL